MKLYLAISLFVFGYTSLLAQDSAVVSRWSWHLYAEAYYSYDFNEPSNRRRPAFLYSYNHHAIPSFNLLLARGAYEGARIRARAGVMAGTYAQANLAAEPEFWRQVYELYAGVKILKRRDLWLEAGVFPSHIGFESAIAWDCWNLSRSMLADNSPYYESGARLVYQSPSKSWLLSLLALNGWQRIRSDLSNQPVSWGTQVTWTPGASWTLNSSSFIGNAYSVGLRRSRFFHNFYLTHVFTSKWALTAGLDLGWEQEAKGSSRYHHWQGAIVMIRYGPSERVQVQGRMEYFRDRDAVIITAPADEGFSNLGASVNVDWRLFPWLAWRNEWRAFRHHTPFYENQGERQRGNQALTSSLVFHFNGPKSQNR